VVFYGFTCVRTFTGWCREVKSDVGRNALNNREHILSFMPKSQSIKPLEIKISTVVAVSAILHESDPALLDAAMRDVTGGESDYFDGELAVLDIGAIDLGECNIDWAALIALFKSYSLNPVAVRNASPEMAPQILAHGLSLDVIVKPRHEVAAPQPTPAPTAPAPVPPPALFGSMIVDTPVRAGQRIYARGSDLVLMAAVNNGAEVIADGSIHIYAPLRGPAGRRQRQCRSADFRDEHGAGTGVNCGYLSHLRRRVSQGFGATSRADSPDRRQSGCKGNEFRDALTSSHPCCLRRHALPGKFCWTL